MGALRFGGRYPSCPENKINVLDRQFFTGTVSARDPDGLSNRMLQSPPRGDL